MPAIERVFSFPGSPMQNSNETALAVVKAAIMWLGALLGSMTLSKLVLFATLVYTGLQTYVLVRDKIVAKRGSDGL